MFRDPRCVFIADSLGLAEIVVLWLKEHGFDAEAMSTATLGGLEGLTWMSNTAISARGIEVWVKDSDQANQARTELEDHLSALKLQAAGTARESVEVPCEECGHTTSFSGEFRGKVQNCDRCGNYLDVPGDEEEWLDEHEGIEDEG